MTRLLNHGNRELIEATLAALDLAQDDVFLDVGFGGGRSLEVAARTISQGKLLGIDFSGDVVTAAQRRHGALIAAGRLNVLTADVAELPLRDQLVNKVATINTLYFWPAPKAALASLKRVLKPGGRLAVAFSGAAKMDDFGAVTSHGFTKYRAIEVANLLEEAGFEQVRTLSQHGRRTLGDHVVTGQTPQG